MMVAQLKMSIDVNLIYNILFAWIYDLGTEEKNKDPDKI